MTFEESYKFAREVVAAFLQDESQLEASNGVAIFSDESQAYPLFTFPYANLFMKESRDTLDTILNNSIREQILKRIRAKQMLVISLTGKEFVDQLTTNLIDGIYYNAPEKSRALRRELVTFFGSRPFIWFCVLVSNVYTTELIRYLRKRAAETKKPGTQQSARTTF